MRINAISSELLTFLPLFAVVEQKSSDNYFLLLVAKSLISDAQNNFAWISIYRLREPAFRRPSRNQKCCAYSKIHGRLWFRYIMISSIFPLFREVIRLVFREKLASDGQQEEYLLHNILSFGVDEPRTRRISFFCVTFFLFPVPWYIAQKQKLVLGPPTCLSSQHQVYMLHHVTTNQSVVVLLASYCLLLIVRRNRLQAATFSKANNLSDPAHSGAKISEAALTKRRWKFGELGRGDEGQRLEGRFSFGEILD